MTTLYKYRIYCITDSKWEYKWNDVPITTCPRNSEHDVNPNSISSQIERTVGLSKNIELTSIELSRPGIYNCNTASNDITISLPLVSKYIGEYFYIKKMSMNNTITIQGNNGETIDGNSFVTLIDNNDITTISTSDGIEWITNPDDIEKPLGIQVSNTKVISLANRETSFKNAVYTSMARYAYQGSIKEGDITKITCIAYKDSGITNYSVRLFDSTHNKVLAENTFTNNTEEIIELTPISNIPDKPAILDLQIKKTGGTNIQKVYIDNSFIHVEY